MSMHNLKQTVQVVRLANEVSTVLITEWDEPGTWVEYGRQVWGLVPKVSRKSIAFFSVVEAQNYADEIGATFIGLRHERNSLFREYLVTA